MKLRMELGANSYDIHLQRGITTQLENYIDIHRTYMIVTDSGVPKEIVDGIMKQLPHSYVCCLPAGEASKTLENFKVVCEAMLEKHFTRKDAVIALGGGVIGDLAGYVAASYMRGVDFINIPTTTLSQIDSSIGGKVAVDLHDAKNIVGAFYQPKVVFIDFNVLNTLPKRHYINGLVEALKAGLIYDETLFTLFEKEHIEDELENIVYRALCVKKDVVEKDEKEMGLRKILNFGHTIGHGIESAGNLDAYLHGEAIALGMLPMIEDEALRKRCILIYEKLGLPTTYQLSKDEICKWMRNDKKANSNDDITVVTVKTCGKAQLKQITFDELRTYLER